MKDSKLIISIVIIALVAIGGYFLLKNNSEETVVKMGEETPEIEPGKVAPKLIDESLVEEEGYDTPDPYAIFDVSYPQFKNASKEFNDKIKGLVLDSIVLHKKDSESNWKARYDTQVSGENLSEFPGKEEKYGLSISWKPVQVNDKFISIILSLEGYTGGAHGYKNTISFNYDVVKNKEVNLKDLFPSDSSYLKTISEFVRKDLQAQFRKSLSIKSSIDEKNFQDGVLPMLLSGTEPKLENFSVFSFTSNNITFRFTEYQVAPYAMGESQVVMPRK